MQRKSTGKKLAIYNDRIQIRCTTKTRQRLEAEARAQGIEVAEFLRRKLDQPLLRLESAG
jgi:hypothetical protein